MKVSFCLPCLESSGDELCFISNPAFDRRIQCRVIIGSVTMDKNWKGWEVWRFHKVDGNSKYRTYIITSWTHTDRILCSNPEGKVYTTTDQKEAGTKWILYKTQGGFTIQSAANSMFLAYSGKDEFLHMTENQSNKDRIQWHLEAATKCFYVSSKDCDKRLSMSNASPCTSDKRKSSWDQLEIEPCPTTVGVFTIRYFENKLYLGFSEDGNALVTNQPNVSHWWNIVESPHGGIFLKNQYGKFLSCDREGNLLVTNKYDRKETWRLEPIMPPTLSANQIWSYVGIGVGAVGMAIAAPFAVGGVVAAMGFETGGIAAGSMAAGMMSAEAIASGGGIVAGGTVATLQSIGAVGLGAAGTASAVGAGALVGGGTTLAVVGNNVSGDSHDVGVNSFSEAPLCSWRYW